MNPRSKERQIYLSRLSPSLRQKIKEKEKKQTEPRQENASERFRRIVEASGLVIEGIDVGRAITWLNQAQQVITKRSEEITNMPEKDAYVKLATVIQAAIPVNNADPDSVESNLNILRQQIQLQDSDSDQLRSLKVHLINKLSEVLNNPQEGTPGAEEAGQEAGPEAGGEMGGPAAPPGGAGAGAPPAGPGTVPPAQ
jgi:hypothetical protein